MRLNFTKRDRAVKVYQLDPSPLTCRVSWKVIPGNSLKWITDEVLSLKIGARYKMRVSAVNGAGLTAVRHTTGLIVDPTPPEVSDVRKYMSYNISFPMRDMHLNARMKFKNCLKCVLLSFRYRFGLSFFTQHCIQQHSTSV